MASETIDVIDLKLKTSAGQMSDSQFTVGSVVTYGTVKPQISTITLHAWELKNNNRWHPGLIRIEISFLGPSPDFIFWVPPNEIRWAVEA